MKMLIKVLERRVWVVVGTVSSEKVEHFIVKHGSVKNMKKKKTCSK